MAKDYFSEWMDSFSWDTFCQLSQRCGPALALIIVAFLCSFFTHNMLRWSLLQHLYHSTVFFFIGFSLFFVIQVKCKVLNALLRDSLAAMLSWQCCRNINCTIFEQAQGGKLSELILLSEPSCAKSKMFGFSIKLCCILFFSWFGWLWVCTHFI